MAPKISLDELKLISVSIEHLEFINNCEVMIKNNCFSSIFRMIERKEFQIALVINWRNTWRRKN